MTYSEIKVNMDVIGVDIAAERVRKESARAKLVAGSSALAEFPAKHKSTLDAVDAFVATNPDDEAAKLAASEKAHLVADFQALKASVDTAIAAL